VEGSIAEGGRDGAPTRKSGRKRHKAKQNPLFVRSLKIGISRLSSECGNNDFPHAVFFTLINLNYKYLYNFIIKQIRIKFKKVRLITRP
jgi:hypothetical protein